LTQRVSNYTNQT